MNALDKINQLWEAQKKGLEVQWQKNGAWVKRPRGYLKTKTGHKWV